MKLVVCFQLAAAVLTAGLVIGRTAHGQDVPPERPASSETGDEPIEINVEGLMEPRGSEHFKAVLELGGVPVGKKTKIHAVVRNPYQRTFEFHSIRSGYRYVHAHASSFTIEPGGSIEVDFELEAPEKIDVIHQTAGASFYKHGLEGSALMLILSYDSQGVLSFPDKVAISKGDAEQKYIVWRIPFLMNEPCLLENIESRGLGAYGDRLVTNVIKDNGAYYVQCEFPTEGLTVSGVSGEVEIRDRVLNKRDTILCVTQAEPEIEVAPARLQLNYDPAGDVYSGSFLIKFRKGILDGVKNLAEGAPIAVRCRFSDENDDMPEVSFQCKARRLAGDVYRVQLTATPNLEKDERQILSSTYAICLTTSLSPKNWESTAKVVFVSF